MCTWNLFIHSAHFETDKHADACKEPECVFNVCRRPVPHHAFHTTRGSYKLMYDFITFTKSKPRHTTDLNLGILHCSVTNLSKNVAQSSGCRTETQTIHTLLPQSKLNVSRQKWKLCQHNIAVKPVALPGGTVGIQFTGAMECTQVTENTRLGNM